MSGFVYFVKCLNRVKIGRSDDPKRRFTKIKSDAPYPCSLIGILDEACFSEREVHKRFSNCRAYGEWFLLSQELLDFIETNCFLPDIAAKKIAAGNRGSLCAYRVAMQIKMADLAIKLDVNQSTVSRWESGDVLIPTYRVRDISEITGIPPHDLRPDVFQRPQQEPAE